VIKEEYTVEKDEKVTQFEKFVKEEK